ncbi:MAG TPA: hypothetical protein VGB65_02680 [Allosphingosinicella sp.]|jgi:hypothetical protein
MHEDISFHSRRAMAELDRALDARSEAAAKAHFALSNLHLDRMRSLAALAGTPQAL